MKAAGPVVVRVPASTSNCGAGFDTIGLALELYNRVTVTPAAGAEPVPERPADSRAQGMAAEAAAAFARATGLPPAGSATGSRATSRRPAALDQA